MIFAERKHLAAAALGLGFTLASLGAAHAVPNIANVSGSVANGNSVTISGSGFGNKVPAEPVLWTDFESGGLGQSADGFRPEIGPTLSVDSVGGSELPGTFNNTNVRHPRSSRHVYLDANPTQGNWGVRLNVPVSRTSGDKLYYRFYLKIRYPNGWNSSLNQKPVDIYNGSFIDQLYTGFADVGGYRSGGSASSPTQWASLNINDIMGEWVNWEEEVRLGNNSNGSRRHWVHRESNPRVSLMWNDQSMNTWQSGGNYSRLTIGEYFRTGPAEYWIDEVYVDYTFARVEIGNAPTFSGSTRREIQIPTAWSSNSVTVTLRQGALSNFDNAYLYVVDPEGNVNATGYPISCSNCPMPPVLSVQ